MSFPFKEVVVDGGAIIELLLLGENSLLFKNIEEEKIIPITTTLGILEAEYIACRHLGKDAAFEKINDLLISNYFEIISIEMIRRKISLLKCIHAISIPDCATISVALEKNIPALFAKKEKKLDKILERKPFEIPIYFLEDF